MAHVVLRVSGPSGCGYEHKFDIQRYSYLVRRETRAELDEFAERLARDDEFEERLARDDEFEERLARDDEFEERLARDKDRTLVRNRSRSSLEPVGVVDD